MKTIEVEKLSKHFHSPHRVDILDDISLCVETGQTIAILGPSGSGKSTLLHMLGTLEPPSSGSISLLGKDISKHNLPKLRSQELGFVFQNHHLIEDITPWQNLLLKGQIGGQSMTEFKEEADELLSFVNLSHRKTHPTKYLSGGEKQRLSVARALLCKPSILFADEPTGNLDQSNALVVQDLLFQRARNQQACVLLVTHDEQLAKRCDNIFTLKDKKLIPLK